MTARLRWSALLVGVVFGFFLTASGLGNYRTIHDGLLLRDRYIYLMMASTVATAATGITLLRRRGRTLFGEPVVIPRHPVRPNAVHGAAVFGVGFGVGATCPGITVSAIATGAWWGALVLLGILAGLWLRGRMERRTPAPWAGRANGPRDEVPGPWVLRQGGSISRRPSAWRLRSPWRPTSRSSARW